MTAETYIPFVLFVLAMTGTPGVGNLTMLAIGQATGLRSALPFLAGTTVGMIALNTMVGLGLGSLFQTSPAAATAMKVAGTAYILYLAWRILGMHLSAGAAQPRLSFVEGVFIHPLNPKSWAMSVVGFSMLSDPGVPLAFQVGAFVGTFVVFQSGCHSLWGWAGSIMGRALTKGPALAALNAGLVTAMVGATVYALFL